MEFEIRINGKPATEAQAEAALSIIVADEIEWAIETEGVCEWVDMDGNEVVAVAA